MSILFGTKSPAEIFLGANSVSQIYLGTNLVWDNKTGDWIVYQRGFVEGISWTANKFPRPQYTYYAHTKFEAAYMRIYITANSGTASQYYNAHVATTNPVKVPRSATNLVIVTNSTENNYSMHLRFGLLPANAPDCYTVTNGGQLSGNIVFAGSTWTRHKLALEDNIKGRDDLYVVINGRQQCNYDRRVDIHDVYFE